jgi:glycosyltransferase involved in cell wall biosynthesis
MKLLFFTPALKKSAIGRMAVLVVRELIAQGHDVTVVRSEAVALQHLDVHDFSTRIISWNELDSHLEVLQNTDKYVYQVGNHFPYHEGCLHWMLLRPGIVSLHDFFVGHLFYEWAQANREEANAILKLNYGTEAATAFFSYTNSESFIEKTRHFSPMTEWVAGMAQCVITHSSWGCERVLKSCLGPVQVVPLPYDAAQFIEIESTPSDQFDDIILLTIGHINPNKRVNSVILAIGSCPALKARITYRLVGHCEPEVVLALSATARQLNVRLVICGEVDDQVLANEILASDIVSCLRWPTLEAASASAIEAMLYGKAVMCTDAGFYAELPDDLVMKISVDNETDGIVDCLNKLISDPNSISVLGKQAREWALRTYSAPNYAKAITNISKLIMKTEPSRLAHNFFSETMAQFSQQSNNLVSSSDLQLLQIFDI